MSEDPSFQSDTMKGICTSIGKGFQRKMTAMAIGIIENNKLIGKNGYIALMIIEHAFLAFMLLINAQPDEDSTTSTIDRINLFSNDEIGNIVSIGFFSLSTLVTLVILNQYLTIKGNSQLINSNEEGSTSINSEDQGVFALKLLGQQISLQRTLATYIFAYSIMETLHLINSEINISSQMVYIRIVLLVLGLGSYTIKYLISFVLMNLSFNVPQIPYNSSPSRTFFLRELFKFFLLLQNFLIYKLDLHSSEFSLRFLTFCMLGFLIFITTFKQPQFFDFTVNRVYRFLNYLILSIGLASSIRGICELSLTKVIIFFPIVLYSIIKLLSRIQNEKNSQLLRKVIEGRKIDEISDRFIAIQQLMQLIERIMSDQGNNIASKQEIETIKQIHYWHSLTCKKSKYECICNSQEFICWQQFDLERENSKNHIQGIHQSEFMHAETLGTNVNGGSVKNINNDLSHDQVNIGDSIMTSTPQTLINHGQNANPDFRQVLKKTTNGRHIQQSVITPNQKTDALNFTCAADNIESQSQTNEENQQKIAKLNEETKITDIFLNALIMAPQNIEKYKAGNKESELKELIDLDSIDTQDQLTKQILSRNLKNRNEAQQYYNVHLLCCILESISSNKVGGDSQSSQGHNLLQSTTDSSSFLELKVLYISFLSSLLGKPYLAIKNLIQSSENSKKSKLSEFTKLQFKICETLIMKSIILEKEQKKDITQNQHNFADFIEQSKRINLLDSLYDDTSREILDFWKLWGSQAPEIRNFFKRGRILSRSISKILSLNNHIQNAEQLRSSDFGRIQLNIFFHEVLINDEQSSKILLMTLRNIAQAKTQKRYKSFSGTNKKISIGNDSVSMEGGPEANKDEESSDLFGLCMIPITSFDFHQLEIEYGNKDLSKIIGVMESKLYGMNIKLLMPKVIRQCHDDIISRFFARGTTSLLGSDRVTFLRDNKGYIKPVKLNLEFSYDYRYKYTFIAKFEPLSSYTSKNINQAYGSTIPLSDSMIFVTDSDNNITEISKTVLNFGGFNGKQYIWEAYQEQKGRPAKIDEFMPEISNFINGQRQKGKNLTIQSKFVTFNQYNLKLGEFSDDYSYSAVLTYLEETFNVSKSHKTRQQIFIITPLSRHPAADKLFNDSVDFEEYKRNEIYSRRLNQFNQTPTKGKNSVEDKISENGENQKEHNSFYECLEMSSQASAISMGTKINQSDYLLHGLLFKNVTPKIIKYSSYAIIGMLLAFLAVSIFNLSIFLEKHSLIMSNSSAILYARKRNLAFRGLLLDISMLHQTAANPSVLSYSQVLGNQSRFEQYNEIFIKHQKLARDLSFQIQMIHFMFNTYDVTMLNTLFLSNDSNTYLQKVPFKGQNSLFMQYIEALNVSTLGEPILNITHFSELEKNDATDTEKQLYFIFMNGLNRMEESAYSQSEALLEITLAKLGDSRQEIKLATYVSVAVLASILFFLIPLFIRLFQRRYQVISFFMEIPPESINQAIANAEEYQTKLDALQSGKQYFVKQQVAIDIPETKQPGSKLSLLKLFTKKSSNFSNDSQNEKKKKNRKHQHIKDDEKQKQDQNTSRSSFNEKHSDRSLIEDEIVLPSSKPVEQAGVDQINQRDQVIASQVYRTQFREKFKITLAIIMFIGYLNSILLISQTYSNQVFQTNEEGTDRINIYFNRENCAMNIVLFLREQFITNQTCFTRFYSDSTNFVEVPGVSVYMSYCLQNEQYIAQMQRSMPDYLTDSMTAIRNQESSQVCNMTFGSTIKAQQCEKAIDGLLKNGVDSAMSLLLNLVNQYSISFNRDPSSRTTQYLTDTLNSQRLVDIVDLTVFYLKEAFHHVQDQATASLDSYFMRTRLYYLLIVCIFVSVTILGSMIGGIFLFQKIKSRILEIQNVLILLPLNDFSLEQKSEIEKHLQS